MPHVERVVEQAHRLFVRSGAHLTLRQLRTLDRVVRQHYRSSVSILPVLRAIAKQHSPTGARETVQRFLQKHRERVADVVTAGAVAVAGAAVYSTSQLLFPGLVDSAVSAGVGAVTSTARAASTLVQDPVKYARSALDAVVGKDACVVRSIPVLPQGRALETLGAIHDTALRARPGTFAGLLKTWAYDACTGAIDQPKKASLFSRHVLQQIPFTFVNAQRLPGEASAAWGHLTVGAAIATSRVSSFLQSAAFRPFRALRRSVVTYLTPAEEKRLDATVADAVSHVLVIPAPPPLPTESQLASLLRRRAGSVVVVKRPKKGAGKKSVTILKRKKK